MKKSVLLYIACCMLFCMTACGNKTRSVSEHKQSSTQEAEPETAAETSISDAGENGTLEDYIEIATKGCKVGAEKEDVRQGSAIYDGTITYRVDKVTLTKQQGDWIDLSGPSPALDEDGRITDGQTYVVLDVTISQEGEFDFWWNSFWLASFTDKDLDIGPSEMVSASILSSNADSDPNIYQYSLPAGRETKTSLVFVAEDSELAEAGRHFLLEYNPIGANLMYVEPEDYSMVFLKSMEDIRNGQAS